jgi:excinuclease UvrABC helicase subunit UvrB
MATSVLSAIQYSQQLAQTDSNGIGSVLGLALYNDALQTMTRDMVNRNIDAAQTQESYTDLTTDSPNTYAWPSDMYMLKTIEVNFQDQTEQNYLQAMPVDVANIQNKSFSWLRANQDTFAPQFDNRGDTFEIFPNPKKANAQGIRIFYYLTPTEALDVGTGIQYPQSLDYRALSCLMASRYYKTQNDTNMATVYQQEYSERIGKIINILAPSSQQPITPQRLAITGWNF